VYGCAEVYCEYSTSKKQSGYLLIIVAIGAIIFTALRSSARKARCALSQVSFDQCGKAKEVSVSGDDVTWTRQRSCHFAQRSSTDLASQLKDSAWMPLNCKR